MTRLPNELASTPVRRVIVTLVAWVCGLLFAVPLLWILFNSFRTASDIYTHQGDFSLSTFWPTQWTGENYSSLLNGEFARSVGNSLFVSAVTVGVGLLVCAMAAFALSVLRFRGAGLVFAIVILSLLIPFDAIAIPLATLFRDWHLNDSYVGLILPGLANGFAIFVLRQFFLAVPWEITEAARVDGLSWWGIFWRMYLPLSKPALVGAAFTLFLFQWQAYLWPLLIGTSPDKILGPIALANFAGQFRVDYGAILAGSVILTAVPMVLLLRYQRHFTASLAATGTKG